MSRWQALLAMVVLFALGVASGGLGAHLYYSRFLDRPPAPPGFFGSALTRHLERALDLTPEQTRQIDGILREGQREAESLRRELAPRLRKIMEDSHRRIRAVLTPEQQERFEELRHGLRRRSNRFFRGPGRHRGPHRRPPPPAPEDG